MFPVGLEVWLLLYYINEEIRLTLIERETHTLHWAIFWFGGGGGGGDGGVVSSSFLERIMLALIFQKKNVVKHVWYRIYKGVVGGD